jgi:hypothetical protein
MSVSDLRYVDSASLSGEMQTRNILSAIGTPGSVVDWVMDLVRNHREACQAYEKELHQVHMDMAE